MMAAVVLKGVFFLVLALNYVVMVSPVFNGDRDACKQMPTARSWLALVGVAALFLFVSPNVPAAFLCSYSPGFSSSFGIRR